MKKDLTLKRDTLYNAIVTKVTTNTKLVNGEFETITKLYVKYDNGARDILTYKEDSIEEVLEVAEVEEADDLVGKNVDILYHKWEFVNSEGKDVKVTKGYVQYRNFTFED